ncbi:MAG: PAS domain S-box protein [Nitrospirae bacterium]|nr:PAS domain S-box protein [Nitrospirota bacterium]
MDELIKILEQFGGGTGSGPSNTVVRFLLPAFFWSVLFLIAIRQWRKTREKRDLYIGGASLIGMFREMLMFAAEYGSYREYVPFDFMFKYYPPLEHAATMLSCIFIAYAFLYYLLKWRTLSRSFFIISSFVTVLVYAITASQWPDFLKIHPETRFGAFWGDMAFRVSASVFMGTALGAFLFAKIKGKKIPKSVLVGFLFFFLDEFLMIFNLATDEIYVHTYAPVRHNLHIWAIPFFIGTYWADLKQRFLEAEHTIKGIFNLSPSMLCIMDFKGVIETVSPASEAIFGISPADMRGRRLSDFGFADNAWRLHDDNDGNQTINCYADYASGDDTMKYLQCNMHPVPSEELIYAVVIDITGHKLAEEAARKSEAEAMRASHLASLGELAAGVAHEINNPVNGIINYAQLLTDKLDNKSVEGDIARRIIKEGDRIAVIVKSLLSITRMKEHERTFVILNELFQDVFNLVETQLLKDGTKIRTELSGEARIWCNPQQIQQVFLNVINNARYALNKKYPAGVEGKELHLRTEWLTIADKPHLRIVCHDNGIGIPKEDIGKIFNPFFSTKPKGEGTGLGMSISYGIIQEHGGKITIESVENEYTDVIIDLPVNPVGPGGALTTAAEQRGIISNGVKENE